MTSGQFRSFPIGSISVGDRQRKKLGDTDDLAQSIHTRGLINPILITRDGVLVAGERRLTACRSLGWTSVPVQFTDEVSEEALHALELEENVKRLNLTWQEECAAIEKYHQYKKSLEPGQTLEDTANELGIKKSTVQQKLQVARSLSDPVISGAPKYSVAVGLVERKAERAKSAEIATFVPRSASSILNADFKQWAPAYSGPPFTFIHCDFPYGINADKRKQGTNQWIEGGYADDAALYFSLIETLLENLSTLATDDCHIMFWFSMQYYAKTRDLFDFHNVFLDPFPLIWIKSDNMGMLPDPQRGPRRIYETCFFGRRGDPKIVRPVSNAISAVTSREIHMSEKPVPVLSHFFRMFVDSNTRMLDPTCGSGSAIRAAKALGAQALGLEINPEYARRAQEKEHESRGQNGLADSSYGEGAGASIALEASISDLGLE